jgi:hypothetical protein
MIRSNIYFAILIMLVAVFVSACASPPATPTPAPTNTTVPPTATPIPPTDTPIPAPTAAPTSAPGSFTDAISKVSTASVYRVEVQLSGKGSLAFGSNAPSSGGTPTAGGDQEIQILSMKGEVKDKDSHFTINGFLALFIGGFLGFDPTDGIEIETVGGKSFMRGKLQGATEVKWYSLPSDQSSAAQPPLNSQNVLESLQQSGLDPKKFQKTASEQLDNHNCDVYAADKADVLKAFQQVSSSSGSAPADVSTVDSAELKIHVCDDGFLHQIRMDVNGHEKDNASQKTSFLLLMHLSDFNGNITIEAPQNAQVLPTPSFSLATPTP